MTLSAISVRGFKSIFNEQRIQLAPITVFAGANSGGKSSASQPLLLLKQTLESQYDPGTILLYGPNAKFTSVEQVVSKGGGAFSKREFSVAFHDSEEWSFRIKYDLTDPSFVRAKVEVRTEIQYDLAYSDRTEVPYEQWHNKIPLNRHLLSVIAHYKAQPNISLFWTASQARCFPDLIIAARIGRNTDQNKITVGKIPYGDNIRSLAKNLIHIKGLRGNPERSYLATARTKGGFPGAFEDYVASILMQWQTEGNDELSGLGNDLRSLGLTWKVKAFPIEGTHAEIKVGRLGFPAQGGANDLVSLADVGLGVSQVLPFLVALRAAKKGQVVFVEQPEIHLHPRAQFQLAEIIVSASKRGILIWLETHSSILIRGLQTQVARNSIDSRSLALNWFQRDPATGGTAISSCVPDDYGRLGDWPADFDDISMQADRAFLDAVSIARKNRHG